jgi:hypothetical protein
MDLLIDLLYTLSWVSEFVVWRSCNHLMFVCVVAIEVEIEIFQDVYWEGE